MGESAQNHPKVLVGRTVTVKPRGGPSPYFTDVHRRRVGQAGRVHAVVATRAREDPLVKVGFGDPKEIVFFRLSDLEVAADTTLENPPKHGTRGSHLPH